MRNEKRSEMTKKILNARCVSVNVYRLKFYTKRQRPLDWINIAGKKTPNKYILNHKEHK